MLIHSYASACKMNFLVINKGAEVFTLECASASTVALLPCNALMADETISLVFQRSIILEHHLWFSWAEL